MFALIPMEWILLKKRTLLKWWVESFSLGVNPAGQRRASSPWNEIEYFELLQLTWLLFHTHCTLILQRQAKPPATSIWTCWSDSTVCSVILPILPDSPKTKWKYIIKTPQTILTISCGLYFAWKNFSWFLYESQAFDQNNKPVWKNDSNVWQKLWCFKICWMLGLLHESVGVCKNVSQLTIVDTSTPAGTQNWYWIVPSHQS